MYEMRNEDVCGRGTAACLLIILLHPISVMPKLQTITQAKPTYVTLEFGDPNGMPQEERVSGDVVLPFWVQVDELRYLFVIPTEDYTFPKFVDAPVWVMVPGGQNCKTLIAPGTITARKFSYTGRPGYVRYSSAKHKELPITPAEGLKQFKISEIRDCCDSSCQANIFSVPGQTVSMIVYNKETLYRIYATQCTFCAIKDGPRTCSNGQYATRYITIDQVAAVKRDYFLKPPKKLNIFSGNRVPDQ